MDRADAHVGKGSAIYDQGRRRAANDEEILSMRITSVEDHTAHLPTPRPSRLERWQQAVRDAGVDPSWRPKGGARGLWMTEHETDFDDMKTWIAYGQLQCQRIEKGLAPEPPEDLHRPASHLRPEARALAPWLTGGKYEANPVPLALVYPQAPRGTDLGGHAFNLEWILNEAEIDEDPDIAYELRGGVESESKVQDFHFAFHHPSFWEDPDMRKKSLDCINDEIQTGAFVSLGELPMVPLRLNPRFIKDEGFKKDGSRKLRAILNLSWGEDSVNELILLAALHDLKLTSGIRFARDVGLLRSISRLIVLIKRDMKNAFRQVPFCPFDWWQQCAIGPGGVLVDTRVAMGCRASVHKFQRLAEFLARAFRRRLAAFDAAHPLTCPHALAKLKARAEHLGRSAELRTSTSHPYVDDLGHALINTDVTLRSPLGHWKAGETIERADAHEAIIDDVYRAANCQMSDDKNERSDETIEMLGIQVELPTGVAKYPPTKIPPLRKLIQQVLALPEGKSIRRSKLETLVGKEKWLTHVALELDHLLTTAYAVANAKPTFVGLGSQFRNDQQRILAALDDLPTVPLVPASTFPQCNQPEHLIVFQDASTTTGIGGWFVHQAALHYVVEAWPPEVLRAFKDKEWSISPAEAWAEVVLLDLAEAVAPEAAAVTDFTDNESTRAAAKNGTSGSEHMAPLARLLAEMASRTGRVVRTLRVTTKENKLADDLSRGDTAAALRAASELNIQCIRHGVPPHLWAMLPGLDTQHRPPPRR